MLKTRPCSKPVRDLSKPRRGWLCGLLLTTFFFKECEILNVKIMTELCRSLSLFFPTTNPVLIQTRISMDSLKRPLGNKIFTRSPSGTPCFICSLLRGKAAFTRKRPDGLHCPKWWKSASQASWDNGHVPADVMQGEGHTALGNALVTYI